MDIPQAIDLLKRLVECPDLNDWERDFFPDILSRLDSGQQDYITDKQISCIDKGAKKHLTDYTSQTAPSKTEYEGSNVNLKMFSGNGWWIVNKKGEGIGSKLGQKDGMAVFKWFDKAYDELFNREEPPEDPDLEFPE